MNKITVISSLVVSLIGSSQPAYAASVPDGEIIVRVDDGAATRCINASVDRITMNLRRLVVNKDVGLFSEDKAAGVLVSTVISGDDSNGSPQKVSFPRMYTVTVAPYASGFVSLPVEEKLFTRFSLANSGNSYDTAELEFSVISKKDKTPFGVALAALEDISKNLPAPINPFSESFKYFSQYANKVVNDSLNKENNVAANTKEGKITMTFSATGTCTGDQEQTGTLAVVKGSNGKESDGYVDIKKGYCWAAELKPVFTLKFASQNGRKCSEIGAASFSRVANPYVAFYLNAEPKVLTSSNKPLARVDKLPLLGKDPVALPEHEVEAAVASSYKGGAPDQTTASIASVVSDSLGNRSAFKFMSVKPNSNDALIKWTTTAKDSVAFDISESLRRCKSHGVSPQTCL